MPPKSKQPRRKNKAVDSNSKKDDNYKIDEEKHSSDDDASEEKKSSKRLSKSKIASGSKIKAELFDDSDDYLKPTTKKTKRNSSNKKLDQENKKESDYTKGKRKENVQIANNRSGEKEVKKPTSKANTKQTNGNDGPNLDHLTDQDISMDDIFMPDWATEPKLTDKQGKYSNDINYDPSTLYIPKDGLKNLSPTMQQY